MSKFDDDINDAIKSFGDKIPKHKAMSKEDSKPEEDKYLTIVTPDSMYWKSVAEELKKENEELIIHHTMLSNSCDLWESKFGEAGNKISDLESQLSKAKELLKSVLWKLHVPEAKMNEIESFLKS